MTNKEQILYSLLPTAEGLLLGTIGGMEIENFNREGASKTLNEVIAILHKIADHLNSEAPPVCKSYQKEIITEMMQDDEQEAINDKSEAEHIEQVFAKAGYDIKILGRL